jgi:hypothetical protein
MYSKKFPGCKAQLHQKSSNLFPLHQNYKFSIVVIQLTAFIFNKNLTQTKCGTVNLKRCSKVMRKYVTRFLNRAIDSSNKPRRYFYSIYVFTKHLYLPHEKNSSSAVEHSLTSQTVPRSNQSCFKILSRLFFP